MSAPSMLHSPVLAATRSTKRITSAAIIAICITVVWMLLNSFIQIFAITAGRTLLAFGGADGRLPLEFLPQLLQADLREGATGFLSDAPIWLRLLCATPTLIHAVTLTLAALLVVRIVRRIAAGHPFAALVLRDWRQLSLVLIAGGVLQGISDTAAVTAVGTLARMSIVGDELLLGADYVGIGTSFPNWPYFLIVLGIVALALASAFRTGASLKDEAYGVV